MKWGVPVVAAVALAGCAGQPSMDDMSLVLMKDTPALTPVIRVLTETRAVNSPRDLARLTRYFEVACAQSRAGQLYDDSVHGFVIGAWPAAQLRLDVLMLTRLDLTADQAIRIADAYNSTCVNAEAYPAG